MTKTTRKRRPAKGTFTYYRLRTADGLYLQEDDVDGDYGPESGAQLFTTRSLAMCSAVPGDKTEPCRVVPLRSAKHNRTRTR